MQEERIKDWIHEMPKVDLHLHLDGSLKPETVLELAGEQGLALPARDVEGLIPYMRVTDACSSLREYLLKFEFTTRFMQTGKALERLAYEAVEEAAGHKCVYVEVRFAPQLHRAGGLSAEDAIGHVIAGLRRGERDYGVKARAIAICMRHHTGKMNMEVVEAAAAFIGHGLVAVDLAGDEEAYPASGFRELFAAADKRALPVTIHAGEAAGADNIREAVSNLGATRIGHGVRMNEDPRVLALVAKRGIPLEMCPVSNIQTKAVAGWSAYPIREYMEQGVKVTINTDNPSVSGTNLTREFLMLREKLDFSIREMTALVLNGLDAAYLEDSEKKALKREVRARLSAMGVL
ncbi:adenosine deaminase [Paenibacillus swuensis]|uniref:adenosine deaminase n=1 Tax=Paenibacillus swuensis TaxID=1178515 RepID=A0A172THS7_9BACL|nr:adenosine deaminase [Paenibacillus swuensis]ANE46570.1 adenosine deaminase [Paenibacillus swuensis]